MIRLQVNNTTYEIEAASDIPLLWVLRDHIKLSGTKYGCGMAQCGACTVHVDGKPVRSCVVPAASLEGKAITTIEGLNGETATAVQTAWESLAVVQCGYCQSGQIMSATALLAANTSPNDEDINRAMSGNICRCATYKRIRAAIKQAALELPGEPA